MVPRAMYMDRSMQPPAGHNLKRHIEDLKAWQWSNGVATGVQQLFFFRWWDAGKLPITFCIWQHGCKMNMHMFGFDSQSRLTDVHQNLF